MSSGEKYVAAAYVVVLVVVLAYLGIISLKLSRLEREVAELLALARSSEEERDEAEPSPSQSFGRAFAQRGKGRVG